MDYHAEPAFSYSWSRVKHCTSSDLLTRTIDKTYKRNLRFHVKYCSKGKVQHLAFNNFLLVLTIFSFWDKDGALHFNSMEFWYFLQSHVIWLVFTIFTGNNHVLFHLLWMKHLVRYLQVPKYYDYRCKFQKWHSWAMVLLILTKYISF